MDASEETYAALATTFGVDLDDRSSGLSMDDVRAFVTSHVARLLDSNPGLLMSILYRIDVAEPMVRRILAEAPPTAIADQLADLIIERQLEKLRIRRTYKTKEEHEG